MLENCISCYAIEEEETLFDEEENELVRVLWFERGMDKHSVVISPDGFIKAEEILSKKYNIIKIKVDEIAKVDAGLSCMSLRW